LTNEPARPLLRSPDQSRRRVGISAPILIVTLAGLVIAWKLAALLLLAFAAFLVAQILRSVATPIARLRQPSRTLAALGVILLVPSVGVIVISLVGAQARGQIITLSARIPVAWRTLAENMHGYGLSLPSPEQIGGLMVGRSGLGVLAQIAGGAFGLLAGIMLVLVGGIYLALQPNLYRRGLLALVPRRLLTQAEAMMDEAGQALRHWLVGQLATMVLVGTMTGTGAYLIGLPSAVALGIIAALLEFVPYAGPVATAVPALLLALPFGAHTILLTILLLIVVQTAEGYFLTPLIQRRAVSLPPALTLFAVFAMGILFGSLGVLLAAPVMVCTLIAIRHLYIPFIERDGQAAGTIDP
jgi:predicted PurR-regulated permease PerM